jgi:hypothetical protein
MTIDTAGLRQRIGARIGEEDAAPCSRSTHARAPL